MQYVPLPIFSQFIQIRYMKLRLLKRYKRKNVTILLVKLRKSWFECWFYLSELFSFWGIIDISCYSHRNNKYSATYSTILTIVKYKQRFYCKNHIRFFQNQIFIFAESFCFCMCFLNGTLSVVSTTCRDVS